MELQRQFFQSNVAVYSESSNDISALRHVAVEAIEIVCNAAEKSHATSYSFASLKEAPLVISNVIATEAPPFRIDEHSDILFEVMSFLYPAEWGMLSLLCRSVAARVATVSETLIQSYLPPHLISTATAATAAATVMSSKTMLSEEPKPYTLDELRTSSSCSDNNGKSVCATYQQVASSAVTASVAGAEGFSWGPNMRTYIGLISMDISGVWRVNGSYTNGDRYCYTMNLKQIGPRRGAAKLEAYVEGEVQLSETEFILIGGKVDGTIAVFHEIVLNNNNNSSLINRAAATTPQLQQQQQQRSDSSSNRVANVVSAMLSVDGRFMSGAWLQHDCSLLRMFRANFHSSGNRNSSSSSEGLLQEPHNNYNERTLQQHHNNNHNDDDHNNHQYPLMILSSGIFRAIKLLLS